MSDGQTNDGRFSGKIGKEVVRVAGPTMYNTEVEVDGVRVRVDPIDRARTDADDNVMAIFQEEQPVTWAFAKPYIAKALEESDGELDFLDVGCGSGIFSLLMRHHFGDDLKIKAIDKNLRAVQATQDNAELNGHTIDARCETYNMSTAPETGVKVLGLYPPHHIYPQSIEDKIPQHARGGYDGIGAWKEQLSIACRHVAKDGIIFFNLMYAGSEENVLDTGYTDPERGTSYLSVLFADILKPVRTEDFLRSVYPDRQHTGWIKKFRDFNPSLHYQVGVMLNNDKARFENVALDVDLKGRNWDDRIELHREIAKHAYPSGR